jgi:hypothetical protein
MKPEKTEYIIQIKQEMTVSRTILATSFEDAVEKAKQYINHHDDLVKPRGGWTSEWAKEAEIVSVIG